MKTKFIVLLFAIILTFPVLSQTSSIKVTDSKTALRQLQSDYHVPYILVKPEVIKSVLDRIFNYLDASTPVKVIDRQTKTEVSDMTKLAPGVDFESGVFELISYEWGVAYGAMLLAGEVTGEKKFTDYTIKRMNLIAELSQYYKTASLSGPMGNNPVHEILNPRSLDDAGSMCAAMIKTFNAGQSPALRQFIDNYIDYISTRQFRLPDGTLGRNRPFPNTLWLDDLYMSVPALAQMGNLTGNNNYFDDAIKQVLQFSQRMFNKNQGLFFHGWVQDMGVHPEFYWARCNGWALLAMTELLDMLPENYPSRTAILDIFRSHIRGLAFYQSGTGFWHQLINRNDSYYETSATAIFTYCIAHAINKGWIDATANGPMAVAGWNAVQTRVNGQGQIEGTCVGTGMSFDPLFYYNRPVSVTAAHGYGPTIMAGAEMMKLAKNYQIVINDDAILFYPLGADWKNYK